MVDIIVDYYHEMAEPMNHMTIASQSFSSTFNLLTVRQCWLIDGFQRFKVFNPKKHECQSNSPEKLNYRNSICHCKRSDSLRKGDTHHITNDMQTLSIFVSTSVVRYNTICRLSSVVCVSVLTLCFCMVCVCVCVSHIPIYGT